MPFITHIFETHKRFEHGVEVHVLMCQEELISNMMLQARLLSYQ